MSTIKRFYNSGISIELYESSSDNWYVVSENRKVLYDSMTLSYTMHQRNHKSRKEANIHFRQSVKELLKKRKIKISKLGKLIL